MQGEDLDFKDISCEIGEHTKSSWHEVQKKPAQILKQLCDQRIVFLAQSRDQVLVCNELACSKYVLL